MNSKTFHWSMFSAALLASAPAGAIGFGEIVLHSRIGEPLRAEIPIHAEPGENIEGACFSLAPLNGSDLPVVSSGKTRLVQEGNRYRLIITGSKPIVEPIFVIGLRASCGTDLQRDFVLTPAEPLVLSSMPPPAPVPAVAPPAGATRSSGAAIQEWRASEGETLENIAETLIPDNLAQQRRMLAALKRANPQFKGRPALAEGTPVAIPDLRQRVVAERDPLPAQQARSRSEAEAPPPPPPPKPRPKTAKPAAPPKAGGPDRVLLGAPPAELKAGETAAPARGSQAETNERMLKLEATIQSLNTQIEALDKALALTMETMALQKKLQAAQAGQPAPAEAGALPAPIAKPAAPPPETGSNWLDILLSALGGGAVAAGLALYLSRRRDQKVEAELPLALVGSQRSGETVRTGRPPKVNVAPAPAATDVPLDGFSQAPEDIKAADVDFHEDESALALAEIMLSFGRVQGAAETLARYIGEHAPDNPRPWLMLLDLYRRSGMRGEYTRLLPGLRQKFNLDVPDWDSLETPDSGLKSLEDYVHITEQLPGLWGTQAGLDYLYRLVLDNRGGKRSGFPLEVLEEIVLLLRVLEDAYGLKRQV